MRSIRVALVAAFLAASLHAGAVRATAFSTDQSDLWWIPAESGWGIQFVQRGPLIFATMFVYGPAGTPVWYTALLSPSGAAWTGDLVATTGPWFGAPMFAANTVMERKAGTMTWTPSGSTAGTLNYTVDGVAVTKNIVREFIVFDDYSGTYLGGIHDTMSNCTNPAKNGAFEDFATLTLTENGTSLTFNLSSQLGLACTFAGTLSQDGRFGSATGSSTCSGDTDPLTLSDMVVGLNNVTLHFAGTNSRNGCVTDGYFSGARHR